MTPLGNRNGCQSNLQLPGAVMTAPYNALWHCFSPGGHIGVPLQTPTMVGGIWNNHIEPNGSPAKRVPFGKEEQRNSVHFCTGARMYALELAPTRCAPTANE